MLGLLLVAISLVGELPQPQKDILDEAKVTLFKLGGPNEGIHRLLGYEVTKSKDLSKTETYLVVETIQKAITNSNGSTERCFEPEVGLRLQKDQELVEIVISFKCKSMVVAVTVDGKTVRRTVRIANEGLDVLENLLK